MTLSRVIEGMKTSLRDELGCTTFNVSILSAKSVTDLHQDCSQLSMLTTRISTSTTLFDRDYRELMPIGMLGLEGRIETETRRMLGPPSENADADHD